MFCLKVIAEFFNSYDLRLPVGYPRTKRQFISVMFKSCQVLLHMLLVCIRSYLKSFMRNKFLNIRPRYIYISKDVRVRGYFSSQKGSAIKAVWEILL
jgi:hypothetical protein